MKFLSDAQIGLAVKAARQAAGWSAKDLAERCSISPTALSKIESGKQGLGFAEAVLISQSLQIGVEHLASLAVDAGDIADASIQAKDRFRRELQILEQRAILGSVSARATTVAG